MVRSIIAGEYDLNNAQLKPMPLRMAAFFFGIPALLGILSIYLVLPALDRAGYATILTYNLTLYSVLPLLPIAALIAYRLEGKQFSVNGLRERFRIHPIKGRDWIWTLGLAVVYIGGYLMLLPTSRWLANVLPLPIPESIPPSVDPRIPLAGIPTQYFGSDLRGNWGVAFLFLVILIINVLGEELWWRGYVLPRQEVVHGRRTWIVHGILWTLFHVPFWWNLVALIPSTFSLSFVASRLRNTTPAILVHFALNGLGYIVILLGVLGVAA
jgi:membrane protease YdiL (CAAX protease family)